MNIDQIFSDADPARNVTEDELAASRRRALAQASPVGIKQALNNGSVITEPGPIERTTAAVPVEPRPRLRFARLAAAGVAFAILVAIAVVSVVVPRSAPAPADESAAVARLFDEAAAVVVGTPLESTGGGSTDSGALRFQLLVDIEQVFKGGVPQGEVLIDVTGQPVARIDSLEEARSSSLFLKMQLFFLDETNKLIEDPLAMLTVMNRRSGMVVNAEGTPVTLPEDLRQQLDLLPEGEVPLETSELEAGQIPGRNVLGVIPEGTASAEPGAQGELLGIIHGEVTEGSACFWYEYEGESWYLRWPKGFSAHVADLPMSFIGEGPTPMVLNEAGYPYVTGGHPIPYLRADVYPPGEKLTCGGRSMRVAELSVDPDSTLLRY